MLSWVRQGFLTEKTKSTIHKITNCILRQNQKLCSLKDSIKSMKRKAIDWEEINTKQTSGKGLYLEYIKNRPNLPINKQSNFKMDQS